MTRDERYNTPESLEAQRLSDRLYQARKRAINPSFKTEEARKYSSLYPEKRTSHWKVFKALKRGILNKSPCKVCGNEKAQAHHSDYSKPLWVEWLCAIHHKRKHLAINN